MKPNAFDRNPPRSSTPLWRERPPPLSGGRTSRRLRRAHRDFRKRSQHRYVAGSSGRDENGAAPGIRSDLAARAGEIGEISQTLSPSRVPNYGLILPVLRCHRVQFRQTANPHRLARSYRRRHRRNLPRLVDAEGLCAVVSLRPKSVTSPNTQSRTFWSHENRTTGGTFPGLPTVND